MNQDIQSLLIDWGGLKHLKIIVARPPKSKAKAAVIRMPTNWKPPCCEGLFDKAGVRLFLPAVKMQSNMAPSVAKIIPSIGYPFRRILGRNSSIR